MAPVPTKEAITKLWVTGLHSKLTDSEVAEFFAQVAPVLSVFIWRMPDSTDCLGFGHVAFNNKKDAISARDSLDSKSLKGQAVRIMLSAPEGIQTNGCAKIYVGNLEATIDSEYLREIFSEFGTLLSCKVLTDRRGRSKGYGFVHYDKEKDAESATEMSRYDLRGKEIEVRPFRSKKARNEEKEDRLRTTVYIKNMSEDVTHDYLISVFKPGGRIRFANTTGGLDGQCRGIGFVTFEIEEEAVRAVEELNGHSHDGRRWQVERAWTQKMERRAVSNFKFKKEPGQATNLYASNIDNGMNDEKLKELFSQFGSVTSCKVMLDSQGYNDGFGFVAFSKADEASKAVNELNGRMIGGKTLYVSVAKREGERKSKLQGCFARVPDRKPAPVVPLESSPFDCRVSAPPCSAVKSGNQLGVMYQLVRPLQERNGGIPQLMLPNELPHHNRDQGDMPNSCVLRHNQTNLADARRLAV